jgi:predicted nucleotidyltransferase
VRLEIQSALDEVVAAIVSGWRPHKVILFGSHAYGEPGPDSDVDLVVVLPTENPLETACEIAGRIPHPLPLDILVRTPEQIADPKDLISWLAQHKGMLLYAA